MRYAALRWVLGREWGVTALKSSVVLLSMENLDCEDGYRGDACGRWGLDYQGSDIMD